MSRKKCKEGKKTFKGKKRLGIGIKILREVKTEPKPNLK